jgi:hypothetical protein
MDEAPFVSMGKKKSSLINIKTLSKTFIAISQSVNLRMDGMKPTNNSL